MFKWSWSIYERFICGLIDYFIGWLFFISVFVWWFLLVLWLFLKFAWILIGQHRLAQSASEISFVTFLKDNVCNIQKDKILQSGPSGRCQWTFWVTTKFTIYKPFNGAINFNKINLTFPLVRALLFINAICKFLFLNW